MVFSRIDAIGLSPGWIRELHLPVVLVSVRPEPGKSENAVRRRGRASARGGFRKPRSLHPGLPEPPAARRPPLILRVTRLPVTLVFIPSVLLSCWASPRSSCPLRAAHRGRGRSTPLVVAGPCAACPPGPRSVNPTRGGRAVCGVPAALPGPAGASVCLPSLLGGRGDGLGMSPAPALPSRARRAARPLPVHTPEARARQASPASSAWGFRGRVTEPPRSATSRLFLFLRRRPPGPPCDSSLNDLPLAVARRPSRPRTSPLIHVRRGQQAAPAWTRVGPVESDRL